MTGDEVCAQLQIDRRQLTAWLREGLPSTGRGKKRVFDPGEVAAWLISHGKAAKPPEAREQFILRTRDEVARHFDVSIRTVATWLRERMPGTPGPPGRQEGYFPIDEIERWLAARGRSSPAAGDDARAANLARLTQARAELIELELAERRANLIPADETSRRWIRHIHEAKGQLGQLPTRIGRLLPEGLPRKIRLRIRARIKRSLDAFFSALEQAALRDADEIEAAERGIVPEPLREPGEKEPES